MIFERRGGVSARSVIYVDALYKVIRFCGSFGYGS